MQIDDRIKHAGRKRRNENGICRILFATRNIEIVDQSFGRAAITNLIKLSIIFTLPKKQLEIDFTTNSHHLFLQDYEVKQSYLG